jgi:two-component system CheB/CheR fusion protein
MRYSSNLSNLGNFFLLFHCWHSTAAVLNSARFFWIEYKAPTMRTPDPEFRSESTYSHSCYDFFLIGIGYSNGDVDPLKEILARLPTDILAAVIVISNGPLDAPDKIRKTLQAVSLLPVISANVPVRLRAGYVYLVPSDHMVNLRDFVLSVQRDPRRKRTARVIDACFRSLAFEGREKTIGVILSGLGYDGLEGAIAVEKHGGLVIAQDPATAKFPMMPVATIANDDPGFILSPEEIGEMIVSQLGR